MTAQSVNILLLGQFKRIDKLQTGKAMKAITISALFLLGISAATCSSSSNKDGFKSKLLAENVQKNYLRSLWAKHTPEEIRQDISERGHDLGPAERNVTTNIFGRPTDTPGTSAPGTSAPAPVTTAPAGTPPSPAGGTTTAPANGSGAPVPAVAYTLQSYLEATLTNDGTITKPGSPQNKAFAQLQTTNPELDPNNAVDQAIITQKYALNTFFYSTSIFTGVTWLMQDLWTTAAPVCGPSNSNWFGVECAQPGVVTSLNLTSNNLNGTLPSELQGLTALSKCNM